MYYIAIIMMIALLYSMLLAINMERKAWNGGICAETGEPWECFDMDSQGGRMYKSGDYATKMHYCTITYSIDNK